MRAAMRHVTPSRQRPLAAALAAVLGCGAVGAADPSAGDTALLEAGRRIYEQGVLTSGQPVVGERPGGFEVEGREAACILCHQRSGMGLAEGAIPVPPVSALALSQRAAADPGTHPTPRAGYSVQGPPVPDAAPLQ